MLHKDDATIKALELMGERARQEALASAEDEFHSSRVYAVYRRANRVSPLGSPRRFARDHLSEWTGGAGDV